MEESTQAEQQAALNFMICVHCAVHLTSSFILGRRVQAIEMNVRYKLESWSADANILLKILHRQPETSVARMGRCCILVNHADRAGCTEISSEKLQNRKRTLFIRLFFA
jgi:hypothetical protein